MRNLTFCEIGQNHVCENGMRLEYKWNMYLAVFLMMKKETSKRFSFNVVLHDIEEMVLHWNFFKLAHASGTIFSFFFISLYVFLCKVFCVSYFTNSWGIFFLGRDTRLCSFQYEIVSMWNFQTQRRGKRIDILVSMCVFVCVCVSVEMCIWSEGDASALYFLLSFLLCKQFYTNSCWPLVQVGKRKVNYHSWSTSRS